MFRVGTKVSLTDFAQQLCHKNADVASIFCTLLDAAGKSPTLIVNEKANTKESGTWVSLKLRTSEAAKASLTRGAAYGSVRSLEKASNVSVSKMRQFLHSIPSYTKFTFATRKFKKNGGTCWIDK